jgi:hypothetical protein
MGYASRKLQVQPCHSWKSQDTNLIRISLERFGFAITTPYESKPNPLYLSVGLHPCCPSPDQHCPTNDNKYNHFVLAGSYADSLAKMIMVLRWSRDRQMDIIFRPAPPPTWLSIPHGHLARDKNQKDGLQSWMEMVRSTNHPRRQFRVNIPENLLSGYRVSGSMVLYLACAGPSRYSQI